MPNFRLLFGLCGAVLALALSTTQAASSARPAAGAAGAISAGNPAPGRVVRAQQAEQADTAAGEVTVTNLRMTTVPGGPARYENKLSAGLSEVYAAFDYSVSTPGTALRIGVDYQDPARGVLPSFETVQVVTDTGSTSVGILAGQAFPDEGAFRPGRYVTTISTSADGGESWTASASITWRMVTIPNDEYFDGRQWSLNNWGQRQADWGALPGVDINAPEAWDVTTGRGDLVIAFIGSGVELNHPDLRDAIWTNPGEIPGNGRDDDGNGYVDDTRGWDFANEDNGPNDDYWTGTFSAGLAAARSNNQRGIAGVAWGVRIMPLKVVGSDGQGYSAHVLEAMHYAADNGARIIHLSSQYTADNFDVIEALRQAIEYVHQKGALVVTGAGDRALNGNPRVYPGAFERVLSVAATDGKDARLPWSSTGDWVDVAAPAQYVLSAYLGERYAYTTPALGSVTTFSAAQVAGLAALVWSVNPDLTPDEVKAIIEETADDLGSPGRDDAFGWGRPNAERAVLATPHRLALSASAVSFIQTDDSPAQVCKPVINLTTSAVTWQIETPPVEWLTVAEPTGKTPSSIEVCADRSRVPAPGLYTTVITATSTLTNHVDGPVVLPVSLLWSDEVTQVILPLISRGATAR